MDYRKFLFALCVAMFVGLSDCGKFPRDLPRCKSGDNECLPVVIMQMLKLTKGGNPQMNLPPFEPLNLPHVNIIQGKQSTIAIELYFKDVQLHGISNAIVNKTVGFERDPKSSKFEIYARVPQIKMLSKYKIDGKVLILPITGSGDSNLSLDNVDIKIKFAPNVVERNGKHYLQIPSNKFKLSFDTSRFSLTLENLFNGNKALGDNMNMFINENWEIILQELKPSIRETLSQIIGGIINNVFDKIPYDDMFSDTAIDK